MVRTGRHLWAKHPAVDNNLTAGDRAADFMKHWFGTWTALFGVAGVIFVWVTANVSKAAHFDPYPFILLNLCLSCVAAVQGIILQISANRQDKINAEASNHDRQVMETLLDLQNQQMVQLEALQHVQAELNLIRGVVCLGEANPAEGTELPDSTEHGDG